MTGCSPLRLTTATKEQHTDTVRMHDVRYDSIYIDNWYYTYHNADTVYVEKTKLEYRYSLRHDTLLVHITDSVPVVHEVVRTERERIVPWWNKALCMVGVIAILTAVAILIRKIA